MIDELKEEVPVLNLLRHLFLKEPVRELVQEIGEIELPAEEGDVSKGLSLMAEAVRRQKDRLDEWIEELSMEFARLFIGPSGPPVVPFASFYLSETRSLMTDETIDVRRRYLEAGVAVKALYSSPEDHIATEIEFIYYLDGRIIELVGEDEKGEASRLFAIRNDFLNTHMTAWVPLFVERVLGHAGEDFYRGAALVLRGTICPQFLTDTA